jgi:putative transposase
MSRQSAEPKSRSPRRKTDEVLRTTIRRVWEDNFRIYGIRKIWRQLQHEGFDVTRCTIERLMREMSLQGVIRGRIKSTTILAAARDPTSRDRKSVV